MFPTVYLNGDYLPHTEARLHLSDLSILRGFAIFDYFRYAGGRPRFLEDHLDRFHNSAREMGLKMPLNREELTEVVHELIARNESPDGGIRFVLTGGYAPDGYTPNHPNLMAMAYPHQGPPGQLYEQGCKVLLHRHLRQIPGVKTTDYIEGIRLLPRLQATGAHYPLYLDQDDRVLESDRSNIFIVQAGTLITPKANVLGGITRKHLMALAGELGIPVEERDVSRSALLAADEAIIVSSTKGALPITSTTDTTIGNGKPGPVTRRLMEEWEGYCERVSL